MTVPVPVMDVRLMWMGMRHRLVDVHVAVGQLDAGPMPLPGSVPMLVMFVMDMPVLVPHPLVPVRVGMRLRGQEDGPGDHQRQGDEELDGRDLRQEHERHDGSRERRRCEISARPGGT